MVIQSISGQDETQCFSSSKARQRNVQSSKLLKVERQSRGKFHEIVSEEFLIFHHGWSIIVHSILYSILLSSILSVLKIDRYLSILLWRVLMFLIKGLCTDYVPQVSPSPPFSRPVHCIAMFPLQINHLWKTNKGWTWFALSDLVTWHDLMCKCARHK